MTTKRRVILEIAEAGWGQTTIDYDAQYGDGAKTDAILDHLRLAFEPIEGEESYKGWSRCTINVSGPMCIGENCSEFLDPKNKEDMADQLCWNHDPNEDEDEGGE